MSRAPVLFVSHGAPTFAVEPGELGPKLQALGASLPRPAAVLIVSPHWQTAGVRVMTTPAPDTVHDFRGFPAALYQLSYPAVNAPDLAREAVQVLAAAGIAAGVDERRGYDHGAWVPLMYLFADADVPVFQVSLPHDATPADAFRLGQALAPLRERGVMIVGSGSLTHNLYEAGAVAGDAPYARAFAQWVQNVVMSADTQRLIGYRGLAPQAERAHPSDEHFLPLLVAAGAAGDDAPQWIGGGITYGVLSMDSYLWREA